MTLMTGRRARRWVNPEPGRGDFMVASYHLGKDNAQAIVPI